MTTKTTYNHIQSYGCKRAQQGQSTMLNRKAARTESYEINLNTAFFAPPITPWHITKRQHRKTTKSENEIPHAPSTVALVCFTYT